MQKSSKESPKIVQTDIGAINGQNKCPRCGTTEISFDENKSLLVCDFCRFEFEPEKVEGLEEDLTKLEGEIIGSGAKDIVEGAEDIITLKCSSCGAEVVIDTSEVTHARCHWCRNTLSINQQVPNGAIPDVVLPFKVTKEEAMESMQNFLSERSFFANPKFKKELTLENVRGVYFPYMAVDVNSHAHFSGEAEFLKATYMVGKTRCYDADVYDVEREFDLTISGLTIEADLEKLDKEAQDKTLNIINSIMPFDVENCVKWNSNYLKGYSLEKRDINIDELRPVVDEQAKDIARFAVNKSMTQYVRGTRWEKQDFEVSGRQWKSAYFPVWLYSYQEINFDGEKKLHYLIVNARTKETIGSIPIYHFKMLIIFSLIEVILVAISLAMFMPRIPESIMTCAFFSTPVLLAFQGKKLKYRNHDKRHSYELETKKRIFNLKRKDIFKGERKGLTDLLIKGNNDKNIHGAVFNNKKTNSEFWWDYIVEQYVGEKKEK